MECEHCHSEHNGKYGSGRFCEAKCARAFSTSVKRHAINLVVSEKLKGRHLKGSTKKKISEAGKGRSQSQETRQKISKTKKSQFKAHGPMDDGHRMRICLGVRRFFDAYPERRFSRIPDSILAVSKRTVRKILKRLGIACSVCGWNEEVCDLHHIHGEKIPNADGHANLAYVCPCCHRKIHAKKIRPEELIPFGVQVGDRWKDYYYG